MKTRTEKIKGFICGLATGIDLPYYVDCERAGSFDDIERAIEDGNGFDIEIIYHSAAMAYLAQADPSLNQSIALAHNLGYETKDINSELLASLLASQDARDGFYSLEKEITEFFNELED